MFYPSPKHHFDTMFVILCVIAGATSHAISNTSKIPINQSSNHYRASFIDFIKDTSLIAHFQTLETNNEESLNPLPHIHPSANHNQQPRALCALFSNLLTGNQMKLCQRHQDLLKTILPQLYPLTRNECLRISNDFKWNCSLMALLLDKSSPLAFTREAALVRSILNASMMYLIVKTCSELNLRSCGCRSKPQFWDLTESLREIGSPNELHLSNLGNENSNLEQQNLTFFHLSSLKSGNPLKLTKTIPHHQGCTVNVAFADAFTRVFTDSDDFKALNKANKILNEEPGFFGRKHLGFSVKLKDDSDIKDLARIKWGKAAINLHNSNIGRQLVRDSIQRRCRCHGLSGVCQFKTCWDTLPDIQAISMRLRSLYIISSSRVQVKDLGTFSMPDLRLFKFKLVSLVGSGKMYEGSDSRWSSDTHPNKFSNQDSVSQDESAIDVDDIRTNELIYQYHSPDYCNHLPYINHPGTKDRACTPQPYQAATTQGIGEIGTKNKSAYQDGPDIGFCEVLCCKRGYRSELVMELVTCNCRFSPCCQVECDNCPRQRLRHFCL